MMRFLAALAASFIVMCGAAQARVVSYPYNVYDLTFTPDAFVISIITTQTPETIDATLFQLDLPQIIASAHRYQLQPADVNGLKPVDEFSSDPEFFSKPSHRIELGTLPPGIYALRLHASNATEVQRITVSSIGIFARVTGSHIYAMAVDLRRMTARTDVSFWLYENGHRIRKRPDKTGLVEFASDAQGDEVLVAQAPDGSIVAQKVDSSNTPTCCRAYATTDRAVYRAGDTVHFWAVRMDGNPGALHPDTGDSWFIVDSPNGGNLSMKLPSIPKGTDGTWSTSFLIPKQTMPGTYRASINYTDTSFVVSTAMSEPYLLSVEPERPVVVKNNQAKFRVSVQDVFGRPVQNVRLVCSTNYGLVGKRGAPVTCDSDTLSGSEAVTNIRGRAEFTIDTTSAKIATGDSIVASVTASNAKGWSANAHAVVHVSAGGDTVSINPVFNPGIPGVDAPFDIDVRNEADIVAPGRIIDVTIARLEWEGGKRRALAQTHKVVTTGPAGDVLVHWIPSAQGDFSVQAFEQTSGGAQSASARASLNISISPDTASNSSYVHPFVYSASAGQMVGVHLVSSLPNGDALIDAGSSECSVSIVRISQHEAVVSMTMPQHGTASSIALMSPASSGGTSDDAKSITLVPPTDELRPFLHLANLRAGGNGKINIEVRDAAGRPVRATLVVGVVRQATARLQGRPQGSIYDAIWSASGYYQPNATQSWWNVNASPISYLHPTPTPRPPGLPYPSTIGRVSSETTASRASPSPSASDPQNLSTSPDTILWVTDLATTKVGDATVNIAWPQEPDAYQVRAIALAASGAVGESELTVLVR